MSSSFCKFLLSSSPSMSDFTGHDSTPNPCSHFTCAASGLADQTAEHTAILNRIQSELNNKSASLKAPIDRLIKGVDLETALLVDASAFMLMQILTISSLCHLQVNTDQFNFRQYFHGPFFKTWWINTRLFIGHQ